MVACRVFDDVVWVGGVGHSVETSCCGTENPLVGNTCVGEKAGERLVRDRIRFYLTVTVLTSFPPYSLSNVAANDWQITHPLIST